MARPEVLACADHDLNASGTRPTYCGHLSLPPMLANGTAPLYDPACLATRFDQ